MTKIPGSIRETIEDRGDDFIGYLGKDALSKISKAENPYREFQYQIRRVFGKTDKGNEVIKYVKDSYLLQNLLYKQKKLQDILPKKFKGSLKRKEFDIKIQAEKPKRIRKVKNIVVNRNKPVGTYKREINGKVIEVGAYNRSKARPYNELQTDFLKRRKGESPTEVWKLFNKTFKTNRTLSAISTKLRRV